MGDHRHPLAERLWERGWDGHLRAQRRRLARLPLAEKLRWLEEAQELTLHLGKARSSKAGDPSGSEAPD